MTQQCHVESKESEAALQSAHVAGHELQCNISVRL